MKSNRLACDDPIGVKNALEAYVKNNGGTAMEETDSYGHTEATNLDLGLYLVVGNQSAGSMSPQRSRRS